MQFYLLRNVKIDCNQVALRKKLYEGGVDEQRNLFKQSIIRISKV
ncbi:unnamed protein product (macronuclear) [Paramecium tetraurelia]|uniref:Uncharacterized protein n=1 Tax=Paramecium tetraurelia TaxID=5888 RepID=A0BRW0_PARTE|nr:uncharacterized protein GSPATT00031508001 [Paramecium tetraurelia]CAK61277.1 unnamed protein product [Paramecium tetraurelia]